MTLPHDPLWPRAGDWPAPGDEPTDFALVGVPTHATSISATAAHETPAAVRSALRYYSEHAERETELSKADWGDVVDPDGDRDAAIAFLARVAAASRLLVALGGDNSLTVPVALGVWGARVASAGLVTLDAHHDIRDGRSNGSPVRELIGIPPVGVNPILVSTLFPSFIAVMLAPFPKCAMITRPSAFDGSILRNSSTR